MRLPLKFIPSADSVEAPIAEDFLRQERMRELVQERLKALLPNDGELLFKVGSSGESLIEVEFEDSMAQEEIKEVLREAINGVFSGK